MQISFADANEYNTVLYFLKSKTLHWLILVALNFSNRNLDAVLPTIVLRGFTSNDKENSTLQNWIGLILTLKKWLSNSFSTKIENLTSCHISSSLYFYIIWKWTDFFLSVSFSLPLSLSTREKKEDRISMLWYHFVLWSWNLWMPVSDQLGKHLLLCKDLQQWMNDVSRCLSNQQLKHNQETPRPTYCTHEGHS